MTLGKYVKEQLYGLASDKPVTSKNKSVWGAVPSAEMEDAQTPQQVAMTYEGYEVEITCCNYDRHSAEMYNLAITTDGANKGDRLESRATALIQRLSYLEEPLAVCELDESDKTLQLRSRPPQRDGKEITYWEVQVQDVATEASNRTTTSITRYRWQPGMVEREAVAYPATFAFVGRLTDSLS